MTKLHKANNSTASTIWYIWKVASLVMQPFKTKERRHLSHIKIHKKTISTHNIISVSCPVILSQYVMERSKNGGKNLQQNVHEVSVNLNVGVRVDV